MKLTYDLGYGGYYLNKVCCKGKKDEITELVLECNGYRIIREDAFSAFPAVQRIVIPEGVTSVEGRCFAELKALREVVFPESLTYIGDECFAGCESLEEIVVPGGITNFGSSVFVDCPGLRKITFMGLGKMERGFPSDAFYGLYDRISKGDVVIELPDKSDKRIIEYKKDMGEYRMSDDFRARLAALPIGKQMLLYCLYRPLSFDKLDEPCDYCPYGIFEHYHNINRLIVDDGILVGFGIRSSDGKGGSATEMLFPFTKVGYQLEYYRSCTGDNNGAGYKSDDDDGHYKRTYIALRPTGPIK